MKDTSHNKSIARVLLLMIFVIGSAISVSASNPGFLPEPDFLETFNNKRLSMNATGMIVLGTWAIGNFVAGGIGWSRATGSNMYFHQGNVLWNTVNMGLAGFGYWGAMKAQAGSFGLYQTISEQYAMEKLLLFNAGLDIGYMAFGLFLIERARHVARHQDRFKGYGQSLLLQGGFLFLFDMILFYAHNQHGKALESIVPLISHTGQGIQVGLSWQF